MQMTGRAFLVAFIHAALLVTVALGDASFTAQIDRNIIDLEDTVRLTLQLEMEGDQQGTQPTFTAPDFDVVNQFSANQVHSFYENGRIGTKVIHSLTKVLRPLKKGNLMIKQIQAKVDGKALTAPDIMVQVIEGAASKFSMQQVGPGRRQQPSNNFKESYNDKRLAGNNAVTVRLELDKKEVYKGEQILASYYLYRKAQVTNIEVDKYPAFKGFLKEDLELPFTGRLVEEQVIVNGMIYNRALLAKYVLYPIKAGRLTIDQLGVKARYLSGRTHGMSDEDDPFAGAFGGLFSQMETRIATSRSEPLTLDVQPIPEAGKPIGFTGAVGQFSAQSTLDKFDLKAHEAMTLTLKIEGKGNANAFTEPKLILSPEIEVYETKGYAKTAKDGTTEKIFEYLLIPRKAGEYTLPPIVIHYFNPQTKVFAEARTEPLTVRVGEGTARPGTLAGGAPQAATAESPQSETKSLPGVPLVPRPLKAEGEELDSSNFALKVESFFTFLIFLASFAQIGAVLYLASRDRWWGRWFTPKAKKRDWSQVQLGKDVAQAYEQISSLTYDLIDQYFKVGARSHAREALHLLLVEEKKLPEGLWTQLAAILEYAETARFALKTGVISEQDAREKFGQWVNQLQRIDQELQNLYK